MRYFIHVGKDIQNWWDHYKHRNNIEEATAKTKWKKGELVLAKFGSIKEPFYPIKGFEFVLANYKDTAAQVDEASIPLIQEFWHLLTYDVRKKLDIGTYFTAMIRNVLYGNWVNDINKIDYFWNNEITTYEHLALEGCSIDEHCTWCKKGNIIDEWKQQPNSKENGEKRAQKISLWLQKDPDNSAKLIWAFKVLPLNSWYECVKVLLKK